MKKTVKVRTEINKIERVKKRKINKIKSWFLKKIKRIDKPPARTTKGKSEKKQITSIKNEREDIITDPTDIKRVIKGYSEHLYAHKLHFRPKDQFFEKQILPKLAQDKRDNIHRPITLYSYIDMHIMNFVFL